MNKIIKRIKRRKQFMCWERFFNTDNERNQWLKATEIV